MPPPRPAVCALLRAEGRIAFSEKAVDLIGLVIERVQFVDSRLVEFIEIRPPFAAVADDGAQRSRNALHDARVGADVRDRPAFLFQMREDRQDPSCEEILNYLQKCCNSKKIL